MKRKPRRSMARVAFRFYEKSLVLVFVSRAIVYTETSLDNTVGLHCLRNLSTRGTSAVSPLIENIGISYISNGPQLICQTALLALGLLEEAARDCRNRLQSISSRQPILTTRTILAREWFSDLAWTSWLHTVAVNDVMNQYRKSSLEDLSKGPDQGGCQGLHGEHECFVGGNLNLKLKLRDS